MVGRRPIHRKSRLNARVAFGYNITAALRPLKSAIRMAREGWICKTCSIWHELSVVRIGKEGGQQG